MIKFTYLFIEVSEGKQISREAHRVLVIRYHNRTLTGGEHTRNKVSINNYQSTRNKAS